MSWLRGSDLQVLSSGWDKFTSDNRIRIFPADQSHSWTLSITNVTTKDTGAYLCQVNTEPKLTLRYILTVEGNLGSESKKVHLCKWTGRGLVQLPHSSVYLER